MTRKREMELKKREKRERERVDACMWERKVRVTGCSG